MGTRPPRLQDITSDLKLIKEAVSKSNSVFRFMDTGSALRGILLAFGILIALASAVCCFLLERYGTFQAIPGDLRIILFVLSGLSGVGLGLLKIRSFLSAAREINSDMTLHELSRELFTPRILALAVPYMTAIALVVVFLSSRGYTLYIIPSLAVLYGLLVISLSSLLLTREFYFLGIWLVATGLMTLFTATYIHPPAVLGITFAAGFVLASLSLYVGPPNGGR